MIQNPNSNELGLYSRCLVEILHNKEELLVETLNPKPLNPKPLNPNTEGAAQWALARRSSMHSMPYWQVGLMTPGQRGFSLEWTRDPDPNTKHPSLGGHLKR